MSDPVVVYVLTGLAWVVVVLTWLRMRADRGAGRARVGRVLVAVHTGVGLAATTVWIVFLVVSDSHDGASYADMVGIGALAAWWVTGVAGLFMLTRWLPSRGRHSADGLRDGWSRGPWLSLLAHLGLAAAVAVFTWAYLTSAV